MFLAALNLIGAAANFAVFWLSGNPVNLFISIACAVVFIALVAIEFGKE